MRSFSTRAAGLLILALGVWGGVIPFVGHYFHFVLGPDKSWTWTSDRFFLDVLPAAVAVLGGLMLIGGGPYASGRLGALLALAAGIWFAIGPDVSLLWNAAGAQGPAHGSRTVRMLEMVSYHTGLGALIAALAGYALPRPRAVVESAAAAPAGAGTAAAADTAVGRGPGYGPGGAARYEEARGAEPAAYAEPAAAEAPVTASERGYGGAEAPAAGGAGSGDEAGSRTAYADQASVAGERGDAVADEPPAAGPGGVADAGTPTYADEAPTATQQPGDAPTAAATQKRRRGGLLSAFRRR